MAAASCSTNDDITAGGINTSDGDSNNNGAVVFSAYTTRETRAADASEIADITALAKAGGFGVFAYEQDAVNFATYSMVNTYPNFFNNQQVWSSTQSSAPDHKGLTTPHDPLTATWMYSPIRYYSNNASALHSFFAYAPYDAYANAVFKLGTAPQIRHSVSSDVDLMWAQPTMDKPKDAITGDIQFTFRHALSKSQFLIAPYIDEVHSGEYDDHNTGDPLIPYTKPLPEGTTVRLRSLKFLGSIPHEALLNIANGEWTMVINHQEQEEAGVAGIEWVGDNTTNAHQYIETAWTKHIPAQNLNIEVLYDIIAGIGDEQVRATYRARSRETFDFEAGKAYKFYLDLGLNSVKFALTIMDWDRPEYPEVLMPIEIITATMVPWVEYESDNFVVE